MIRESFAPALWPLWLGIVALALVAILGPGCATGRTPDGRPIAGFPLGEPMPEGLGEAAQAAAGFLPPPFNWIAGGVVTALGIGGPVAAAHYRARHTGWDEREADQDRRDARGSSTARRTTKERSRAGVA